MPHLTAQDFAETINGRTYPLRITKEEAAQAKSAGLVVVYGASDDLMEFEGAISDEIGAWNGTTASVSPAGIACAWDSLEKDDEEEVMRYFEKKRSARDIEAIWCPDEPAGASWAYKTDVPHATFDVIEDGEIYCRGIVFSVADLAQAAPAAVAEPNTPFTDPRVQIVYGLLADSEAMPPDGQHWEGWVARRIVDALAAAPAAAQPVAQEAEHIYAGDCPDECQPSARDPECPACRLLDAQSTTPPALVGLSHPRDKPHSRYIDGYGYVSNMALDAIQRALAAANGMTLKEPAGEGGAA